MADAELEVTEQMVTQQHSLEMQEVQVVNVKSTSVTEDIENNANNGNNEIEWKSIDKKDTTLKDNEPNNDEDIDTNKVEKKIRKQSLHLQQVGDAETMRELGALEAKAKAASPKLPMAPASNSFLGIDNSKGGTDSIIQITPTSSFIIRHDVCQI